MKRTRAIEILEKRGLTYEVRSYESDRFLTAVEVAERLRLPPSSVFKTLVARGERTGVVLALVPGDRNLSLRRLAQAMGDKRADMVEASELLRLTGYIKGGVSPIGGRQPYPVFIDETALEHERISISAGVRGTQILLAPADLARLVSAAFAQIQE